MKRLLLPIVAASLAACVSPQRDATITPPFAIDAQRAVAPLPATPVPNYTRVAPYVATSGDPGLVGVDTAKAAGFKLMLDLRQPAEAGVAEQAARAQDIGLRRVSLPMPAAAAAIPAFLDQLTAYLDDPANYPILLNCGSANRAAGAWTLYRVRHGVPVRIALEEGRAAGLTSREALVREVLGLPPLNGAK
ncbi:MAG: hypothetical protein ACOYM8_10165 [Caulobacterales bacterium]